MPAPPEESEPAMVSAMAVMTEVLSARGQNASAPRQPMVASPGNVSRIQVGDQRHGVGEEEDAGQHEETAKHFLDRAQMASEALHRPQERLDGEGGEDEGNAEAKRIDQQQADALAHRVLARGDGQDRASTGPMQGVQPKAKASPMT